MSSKRDRRVAFADDVDIVDKKARIGNHPGSNKTKVERSEHSIFNAQELINMCKH